MQDPKRCGFECEAGELGGEGREMGPIYMGKRGQMLLALTGQGRILIT